MNVIQAQKYIPPKAKDQPNAPGNLCPDCYTSLQGGADHRCVPAAPVALQMMEVDEKSEEERAAKVVRQKLVTEASTSRGKEYGTLTLATGGPPIHVEVKRPNPPPTGTATTSSLIGHMKDYNLSMNQLKKEQQFIRGIFGRKSVEAHAGIKIAEATHEMDRFFDVKRMEFTEKDGKTFKKIERPVVYVKDITELICYVLKKNDMEEEKTMLKIGIDDGQGFLKICILFINKEKNEAANSVKDVALLSAAPQVKESYDNLHVLWELVRMNEVKMKLAADLKVNNLVLGIQSHSSCHSCYICNSRNPFEKGKDWPKGEERTLGKIRENVRAWRNAGSKPSKSKDFDNCTNFPLFNDADSVRTIDLIPPCELHLLLGPVNHMLEELLKIWPECDQWVAGCNAYRRGQDHGQLNGNGCSKLLQEESLIHLENFIPEEFAIFGSAFRAFSDILKGCYSYKVSQSIENDIEKFRQIYLKLNITITPKVHIVLDHLYPFLKDVNTTKPKDKWSGLAMYSEQAFESVHAHFKKRWEHYKVNLDSEEYDQKLLRAVCCYNSLSITKGLLSEERESQTEPSAMTVIKNRPPRRASAARAKLVIDEVLSGEPE